MTSCTTYTMTTKQTYVVWAPADPKPEVLERRTTVRPDHLKHIARIASEGSLSASFPVLLRWGTLVLTPLQ